MNNFFYVNSDYDLFKKAFRSTKNEPVIINIMSNDSSLKENTEDQSSTVVRKNMSSKFQASPFDKFFGPRKKRTDPLDMKDFSSWRNKNYRDSEKQINEAPEEITKFSFSDYLNSKTKTDKYNDEDKLKSELQKPIDQMSISDDNYKKFSLDSYLNKLEQETKAKKDFSQTEDLVFATDDIVSPTSEQDENFDTDSEVDIEEVAFDEDVSGEKFAFDREELDKVKLRLEKIERESNNIKEKSTQKVISTNELSELTHSDDEDDSFDLDKLGFEDDIERVNEKLDAINKKLQITGDSETTTPKVEHKRFVEINKTSSSKTSSDDKDDCIEKDVDEKSENDLEDVEEKSDDDFDIDSKFGSDDSVQEQDTESESEEGVVEPKIIDGAVADSSELDENDSQKEQEDNNENSFVDVVEIPKKDEEKSETETDVIVDDSETDEEKNYGVEQQTIQPIATQAITDIVGSINPEANQASTINSSNELLTKGDIKNITDEIVNKFSSLYRGGDTSSVQQTPISTFANPYAQQYDAANPQQSLGVNAVSINQSSDQQLYQKQQAELQTKIIELIEQNKKSDSEIAEKLQLAELEKQRVAEQYESRLRELEESIKKREEEAKQQVYIEKLKNDIKIKKSESSQRLREEKIREDEKLNSENQFASEKLKSELKNSLNVSNLEMDKKLLECVTKMHKSNVSIIESGVQDEQESEVVETRQRRTTRSATRTTSRRRSSSVGSRMRTRTPRRKIDSDIIGGINFD